VIYPLYTLALSAVAAAYLPAALWRRATAGVPLNLRARLGWGAAPVGGASAWIHAVSVGEAIAAQPLVDALQRAYPELRIVVSTVTVTGARVVRERYAGIATHRYFPLDVPGAVRRVLNAIDPVFLICMETELWPNVLRIASRRGVPVMIANGRLSDRSFHRYRLARPLLKAMLDDVTVFAMQSEEDARRMIALGAAPERVFVTGNLKHEPLPDAVGIVDLWRRLLALAPDQRVWIAGSTHGGEDDAVLAAHAAARAEHPGLVLVLAPRHPERVSDVVRAIRARGWQAVRRSELPRGSIGDAVIVLDTVGELAQLYAVADVVFVGGSLVPVGGHNMLEPALRRKPVLFGPHTTNFREVASLLVESGGAVIVRDERELAGELRRLLADPGLRDKMGAAGQEAAASRHGAVSATLELVERFLRPVRAR